jgi:hypothetical protein
VRLIAILKKAGVRAGRLFQRKLDPPRMFEWEEDFMTLLELAQATTDLIGKEIEIRDTFGISRTTRGEELLHTHETRRWTRTSSRR